MSYLSIGEAAALLGVATSTLRRWEVEGRLLPSFRKLAPDYLERREAFRQAHLAHAWASQARGELVLAGALADSADTAMLLFKCDSPELPGQFALADPYFENGLVTGFEVRLWATVVGDAATTPLGSR